MGWVVYRCVRSALLHPERALYIGLPAAFLFVVLLKGLFTKKKHAQDGMFPVTAAEQPQLLAFIHRVADDAGAGRPKRVFLSADVNAVSCPHLTLPTTVAV